MIRPPFKAAFFAFKSPIFTPLSRSLTHGQKPATASADSKFITATIHDQKLTRGTGGELHQTADGDTPVMTLPRAGPVADDQNSLRVGPRGPLVVDDFHFREKMFQHDHERKAFERGNLQRTRSSRIVAHTNRTSFRPLPCKWKFVRYRPMTFSLLQVTMKVAAG